MWLIVAILAITTLVMWSNRKHAYFKGQNIPHFPGYFPLGSVNNWNVLMGRSPFADVTKRLYDEFPGKPIVGYYGLLGHPILVIRSLDIVKRILVKDFDYFVNPREFHLDEEANKYFVNSVLVLGDEKWKMIRNIITPIFTSGRLKGIVPLMHKVGHEFTNHLDTLFDSSGALILNPKNLLSSMSFEIIMAIGYGVEVNAWGDPENVASKMGKQLFGLDSKWNTSKFMMKAIAAVNVKPLKKFWKFSLFDSTATEFFADLMRQTLRNRKAEGVSKRNDLVDLMIQAFYDDENRYLLNKNGSDTTGGDVTTGSKKVDSIHKYTSRLSDEEKDLLISSQAFLLFFAALQTTSTTLTMALYFLATHPEYQEDLSDEIQSAVDNSGGDVSALDYTTVNRLIKTEMFLNETMRIYNFVGPTERTCTKDYYIPELDFTVKKGMAVQIPSGEIQLDAKYFDDPMTFNPKNFDPEERMTRSPFTFMAFSHGPRNCIGMRFAYLQMKLAMAHIIYNYKIMPCDKTPEKLVKDPLDVAALPIGGVWVKLHKHAASG